MERSSAVRGHVDAQRALERRQRLCAEVCDRDEDADDRDDSEDSCC